jgi:Phytanoyl-CoA dioxygenase (PhyH)
MPPFVQRPQLDIDHTIDIRDPNTWLALAPALSIGASPAPGFAPFALGAAQAGQLASAVRREGYLQLDSVDWGLPISALAEAITNLHQAGWPPVFGFVYDEFWLVFAKLDRLIAGILDGPYSVLPDFWAWHVDPANDDSGWAPHRDKGRRALFEDGSPKSLTVWLPLTDATPLNGCMYLVPADRDPTYGREDEIELRFRPQDIRALPAAAGSILLWNQAVCHWGARSAPRAVQPRISLSAEFQRSDVPPFNTPLMQPLTLPSFETRLRFIGRQVLRYRHMYALDAELAALAESLSGAEPA